MSGEWVIESERQSQRIGASEHGSGFREGSLLNQKAHFCARVGGKLRDIGEVPTFLGGEGYESLWSPLSLVTEDCMFP